MNKTIVIIATKCINRNSCCFILNFMTIVIFIVHGENLMSTQIRILPR